MFKVSLPSNEKILCQLQAYTECPVCQEGRLTNHWIKRISIHETRLQTTATIALFVCNRFPFLGTLSLFNTLNLLKLLKLASFFRKFPKMPKCLWRLPPWKLLPTVHERSFYFWNICGTVAALKEIQNHGWSHKCDIFPCVQPSWTVMNRSHHNLQTKVFSYCYPDFSKSGYWQLNAR